MIVGLGNPGKEYNKTRHNVGYMVLDNYASKKGFTIDKSKFNSVYQKTKIKNEDVLFVKPETFMNLSGNAVEKFAKYYKIDLNDILIIHDDLDLDVGRIRLRYKGKSGGHNGIKDIILNLSSENFKRLKIGVGNNKVMDTKDYILGKFTESELLVIKKAIDESEKILDDYITLSFDNVMNKYNHR